MFLMTLGQAVQAQEEKDEATIGDKVFPDRRRVVSSPTSGDAKEVKPVMVGGKVELQMPNADVLGVLAFYSELTGKEVVRDNSVQGQVPLMTSNPMEKKEAIEFIERSLFVNGFFLIKDNAGGAVLLGPGKPTRSCAIPIYFDEKDLPEGISIVSYVFKLENLQPGELANLLNQYMSTGQPYSFFAPLPASNYVLVTESTTSIRALIPLVRKMDEAAKDRPPESTTTLRRRPAANNQLEDANP